jgi:hypothetical protein
MSCELNFMPWYKATYLGTKLLTQVQISTAALFNSRPLEDLLLREHKQRNKKKLNKKQVRPGADLRYDFQIYIQLQRQR